MIFLPITATMLIALLDKFSPGEKSVTLMSVAADLLQEIYMYRLQIRHYSPDTGNQRARTLEQRMEGLTQVMSCARCPGPCPNPRPCPCPCPCSCSCPCPPVIGVLGLCWMWQDVPFARQWRPVVGVLGLCWLLWGSFDCFCCPHTSVLRLSTTCLAVFPSALGPGALLLHALSWPSTTYAPPLCRLRVHRAHSLLVAGSARFMVDAGPPPPCLCLLARGVTRGPISEPLGPVP